MADAFSGSPTSSRAAASRAEVAAEDAKLMAAFKRGDAKAFERLLRRYRTPMYNFCFRMLGHPSAAEDAMQEVFLKVVRSAGAVGATGHGFHLDVHDSREITASTPSERRATARPHRSTKR